MLGQRTLTLGPMVPCPIHTARKLRSAYPLLCAPVRHPTRTEQYESETEDDLLETTEADTEEEDDDDETTTESVRNTTKAVLYDKKNSKIKDWKKYTHSEKTIEDRDSVLLFRTTTKKRTTKGLFLDKLDQELDSRKKAEDKFESFKAWQARTSDAWHPRSMEGYEAIPTKSRKQTAVLLEGEPEFRRFTDMAVTTSPEALVVRHKWKQTRDRPQRPGANALLNLPVTAHTHRSSIAAMMFDKEDVDQLFRDTGFNPSWMRRQGNK
ncbi:uncharacterized protein LOC135083659 [Ostrinia nubilalis]|uniref:uncharacterized protein LOC135083659 n=1 Tax=Ostrinia nubilalis TaxID=29057 RepID=UPI00308241E4